MWPMWKYLRLIFTAGIRIVWDFLFYINRYARNPEKYPLELRYRRVRALMVYVVNCMHPDFKVTGIEHLRALEKSDTTFLLTSNHQSDMDPVLMVYFSEKPISFVAKAETRKMPFIGKIVRALDGFFLERNDLRKSLRTIMDLKDRLAKGGLSYMIYPEGTRNKHLNETVLLPYKAGAFKAGQLAGVPVLPVSIWGTQRLLSPKVNHHRIPIEVTFFEPFSAERMKAEKTETIAEENEKLVRAQIAIDQKEDKEFYEKRYEKVPLRKGPVR